MSLPTVEPYAVPEALELPSPRVAWRPSWDRAVLLVHDMQRYFLDIYDPDASPLAEVVAHIDILAQYSREMGIPVVYTAQPANQSGRERGLLQDWWGDGVAGKTERAAFYDALAPHQDDKVLNKLRYSAFRGTELAEILRVENRDQLLITGVYGHIGCLATALDAFMQDIQPFFVADAIGDFSEADHRMAVDYVARRCGVPIATGDLQAALGESDADARTSNQEDIRELDYLAFLRAAVAEILGESARDIDAGENLLESGLDSVRLMALVEHLRADGYEVTFVELATEPTLRAWSGLLAERDGVA